MMNLRNMCSNLLHHFTLLVNSSDFGTIYIPKNPKMESEIMPNGRPTQVICAYKVYPIKLFGLIRIGYKKESYKIPVNKLGTK